MDDVENGAMHLELKYCERCGGLWLRPTGSDLIFCAGCSKIMAGLAPLWPPRRKPAVNDDQQSRDAQAFWGEGGNA